MVQKIARGTRQYWYTIAMLFLGSLVSYSVMYSVQPLIPIFSREFNLTPSVASLAMSATTGGVGLTMLVIAKLSNRLDRKMTMLISLLGAVGLTGAIAVSKDFNVIVVCRALLGVLVAGFPAAAMAYITEEFEPGAVGLVIGIYISGSSIGGLTGRFLVSMLTDLLSWQNALLCVAAAGLAICGLLQTNLPKSKQFFPQAQQRQEAGSLLDNLHNTQLLRLYLAAFLVMGAFSAVYNFIGYPLMNPPYNLSQTVIGSVFSLYLVGTFSSAFMGGLADRYGNGEILCLSIGIMLAGGLLTLAGNLIVKIIGLAVFTYGFFGSHSTACSWVGKLGPRDKGQASSLYFVFYYLGGSAFGTVGGICLHAYNWPGVVGMVGVLLVGASFLVGTVLYERHKRAQHLTKVV